MTEIEVPLEKIQEDIHHAATHGGGGHSGLMTWGALISAILAVFAAVAALQAGHYANEAMIEQIESSDQWSFYQAKGIKASITELKAMTAKNKEATEEFQKKLAEYKHEQAEIKEKADEKVKESKHHLHKHETLATSVTFFQIAIAMIAIAVLVRRKQLMWVSVAFGVVGVYFLSTGFLMQ